MEENQNPNPENAPVVEEESFIDSLYASLGGEDRGWDKELFAERISTDADYNEKIFGALGEQEFSQKDFQYATGLKKKEQPEDPSGQVLESLSDLTDEQLASLFPEETPQYMLDIYREAYNPSTGDFDFEALNNYETELQGRAREHKPQDLQIEDKVERYGGKTYVNGVLREEYNEGAEMERELLEATVKDRERMKEEEAFRESLVTSLDLYEETGVNVRVVANDFRERVQNEHSEAVKMWMASDQWKEWSGERLDAIMDMGVDQFGRDISDDPNRMITVPADMAMSLMKDARELGISDVIGDFKSRGVWTGGGMKELQMGSYEGRFDPIESSSLDGNGKVTTKIEGLRMSYEDYEEVLRAVGLRRVNQKFQREQLGKYKQEFLGVLGGEGITDGDDKDQDIIDKLDDYMFFQHGLALDLDGNGRYNEKWLVSDMARGLYQGTIDLVVNPAEYLYASVKDEFTGGNTAAQVRRENAFEAEKMRSEMTVIPMGIGQSFANGDIYNGFRQSAVGLAETLPTVGLVVASSAVGLPMVGAGLLGVSSGINQFSSTKTDDEILVAHGKAPIFENDLQRLGSSMLVGGSETAFALVGSAIFGRAASAAEKGLRGATALTRAQGRIMTKEMATGMLKHYGLSGLTEGLEEVATTATTMIGNAMITGKRLNTDEFVNGVVDSFIVGALAGGVFEYSGTKFGQARAAMFARGDMVNIQAEFEARDILANLEKQARDLEPGSKERRAIEVQIQNTQKTIKEKAEANRPFYDMLAVRHPDVLNKISELDVKIENSYRQFQRSVNPEQAAVHKAAFEQLVRERTELTNQHKGESTEMTQDELDVARGMLRQEAENRLTTEKTLAENAVAILEERIANGQSVDEGALRTAREARDQAAAEYDAAVKARQDLEAAEKRLAEDNTDENLSGVMQAAAHLDGMFGLPVTQSGDVRAAGDIVATRVKESKARRTDSWIATAIENMENSGLTKEEIDSIFASDEFAVLTAENPMGRAELSDAENEARNQKAREWLESQGLVFHEVKGKYQNGENSFLVEGMTVEQAQEFAAMFEQETVAHKKGLVKANGDMQLFAEGVNDAEAETDFFSAIKDKDGNVKKFNMTLTETFQNSKGEAISKDQFVEGNTVMVDGTSTRGLEGKYNEYTSDENGEFEISEDDLSGLNEKQRKFLTNALKALRALHPGLKLRMHSKESMDAFQENAGGYVVDGVIHISVDNILTNMLTDTGLQKKKTFEETVLEEVIHTAISPMLAEMNPTGRARLARELAEILGKNSPVVTRAQVKYEQYIKNLRANGYAKRYGEDKVMLIAQDEMITEMISALAANPDIQKSLIGNVKLWFNSLFSATNNKFVISSDSSAAQIVTAFANSVKDGSHISVKEMVDSGAEGRSSGRLMMPQDIPAEGEFEVTYSHANKHTNISRVRSKTFRGKWDFINYWNHITNNGQFPKRMANVKIIRGENTGMFIDADRMINWNLKPPKTKGQKMAEAEARRVNRIKYQNELSAKVREQRKNTEEDFQPYVGNDFAVILDALEIEYDDAIDAVGKIRTLTMDQLRDAESIIFGDDKAAERASLRLIDMSRAGDILVDLNTSDLQGLSLKGFHELKVEAMKMLGFTQKEIDKRQQQAKSTTYQFVAMESARMINAAVAEATGKNIRFQDMSSSEKLALLEDENSGVKEAIVKSMTADFQYSLKLMEELGMENPETFFSGYEGAKQKYLSQLSAEFPGVPVEQFSPILDVLVAATSTFRPAEPNMRMAMNILHTCIANFKRNYIPGKPFDFIPKSLIDDLKTTDKQREAADLPTGRKFAESNIGVGGASMTTIGATLETVNDLFNRYLSVDGKFDADGFVQDMTHRSQIKSDLPVASEEMSKRKIGAPKIGSFAATMMGALGQNFLTQDSHFMDYMGVFTGEVGVPRGMTVTVNRAEMLKILKGKVSPKAHTKTLVKALLAEANAGNRSARDLLADMFNPMSGRNFDKDAKKLRYKVVEAFVNDHNRRNPDNPYTIAQVGQMMYAFDQIAAFRMDLDSETAQRDQYTPWHPIMEKIMEDGSYRNLSVEEGVSENLAQEEVNRLVERSINVPAPEVIASTGGTISAQQEVEMEGRASSRLQLALDFGDAGLKVNAEDSRLFRDRSDTEALALKGEGKITQELVDQALQTDRNSVRVMNKGKTPEIGDKVGVRLNLNVLKNTGVPVQTIHDKTATGEALQYAPVVRVSNVTMNVNQEARNKIVTFQENKFPMASVDGELVSTDMSEISYEGVKAIFNPFKHNTFVDVSGRPIKSAENAVIVGNNVYLTGEIEYFDYDDPVVTAGRTETEEQRAKRVKRGPKYDAALKRFRAYSEAVLGVKYESDLEAKAAYDSMPINSQVALNESEVAKNAEEAIRQGRASARIRQTAGRTAVLYDSVRSEILQNPENYISTQNLKEAKDKLSSMDSGELMGLLTDESLGRLSQRNDDMGVLAGVELINRAVADGNPDSIPGIVAELSKIGTTAGRLLRHFAELKSSTPAGMIMMIEKEVERGGNKLSDAQKERLTALSVELMESHAAARDLMERAIRGEEVDAELETAVKRLKQAERSMETFTNAVIERGWGDIGSMLVQGNLLTPMSQVTNVIANLYNAALMIPRDIIALPIEKALNLFGFDSPIKRNYSVNAYMYGLRKFGAGFVESLEAVVTGQEKDVTEWRVQRGFAPFRSILSAFGKGAELPLGPDGKSSLSQRLKLFINGTLGIPAEVMFRFLGVGDTPFRRGVEGIEVYQEALSRGLKGEELRRFLKHPPMDVRQRAEQEGRKLTFQEQGVASNIGEGFINFVEKAAGQIFGFLPGVNGQQFAKFLIRSQMPYVRTPANILYETLTFTSPVIAIPRIMADLKKGDARSASQNMGKLIVGQSVAYATELMIREGIISGALEAGEDEERNIAYDQFPPNSINISALKRFLAGATAAKQPDDYFMSYQKLGIFGAIIGARVKATNAADPSLGEDPFIANRMLRDAFGVTAFSTMAHMMDQSFLQGVSSFTELISAGDADDFERKFERWSGSTFQAVSSTILPNTLSALYKQNREYLPDTRVDPNLPLEERIMQRFRYTFLDRTFGLGDAPIRVNWKGEPIRQRPRGDVPGGYYLFDVYKSRQGEADPVSNEVWRLFEQTEELTSACGTPYFATTRRIAPPKIKTKKELAALEATGKEYSFLKDEEFMNSKVRFSIEDINDLAAVANRERYQALEKLVNSEEYKSMSDADKLEAMNNVAGDFSGIKEFGEDKMFKKHTIMVLDIMQRIYDDERR